MPWNKRMPWNKLKDPIAGRLKELNRGLPGGSLLAEQAAKIAVILLLTACWLLIVLVRSHEPIDTGIVSMRVDRGGAHLKPDFWRAGCPFNCQSNGARRVHARGHHRVQICICVTAIDASSREIDYDVRPVNLLCPGSHCSAVPLNCFGISAAVTAQNDDLMAVRPQSPAEIVSQLPCPTGYDDLQRIICAHGTALHRTIGLKRNNGHAK
jgi:hypothetical protein